MDEKNTKIKRALIVTGVLLCLVIVIVSVVKQCDTTQQQNNSLVASYDPFDFKSDVGYYTPSEGEDIFDDEKYLEKNRYFTVEYQGTTTAYTDDEIDSAPLSVQMLYTYITAATNGDGKTLNSLFTDYYFNNFGSPIAKYDDTFYQQKIYNIDVALHSGPTVIPQTSGNITREIFQVSYYIMDNNGAFRPDLPDPEDGTIPLFFEVITADDEAKINQIFIYSE